ncbi:hypothetical protein SSS_04896 [Sarcoptes scabiei]|uniref:Uncharacterized protein n=1 Tax=Sarcoptes scabiei TaxID=52283 RepID=A0A834RFU5_SARSC|nr:hypothetical protein SSS_04896 [Sarcoptes scabiei]
MVYGSRFRFRCWFLFTRLTNSKSVCNLRTAISSFPDHRQNHRNSLYGTLSSRKGHTNLSNNIYSGANGGDDDDDNVDNDGGDNRSYLNQSILDFHKSISLSDLSRSSCTLPRKLSVFRRNLSNQNNQNLTNLSNDNSAKLTPNSSMNNYQFAPLWDQRQRVVTNPPGSGQLSRTPSTNALNKAEMMRSQSTLCRQGLWNAGNQQSPSPSLTVAHMKPPIHVNGSMVANVATPMMNLRSGRSSAPPSQFRKSAATISCASSSRRGDSTEDDEELDGSAINSDEENSEEHRAMRPRPFQYESNRNDRNPMMSVTSSANVSSTNQFSTIPNNNPHHHHYIQNPNHSLVQSARPRRLWSTDTIRSSKSEFNLANIGRDIPLRRRNNSGMNSMLHPQLWPINMPTINNNQHGNNPSDRFDLSLTNPSSIPLSLELCQHLINEMSFLINYASRIHERASNSENVIIVDYLRETLGQASRDIQVIVNRNNQNQISNNKIVENGQNLNSPNTINKQINGGEIQSNRSNDHNEEKRKQSNEYDSDVKNNNSIVSNSFIDQDSIQQEQLFRQFLMFLKMNNGNTTNNGENKSSNNQNNLNDKNLSQSAQSVTLQSNPIESSKMVSSQSKSSSPSSGSISNFNIASVNVNSNRSNME